MNIGQMVRGLMGDVKAGDAKQLELKSGQVVRGVVSQVSDDGQEAVMNINGVQVKAKLESPLAPGQTTMLQVQPETSNGMVVLKPLQASPNVPIPEQSMGDVLKSVGLPDQKWSRELVQLMQQNGVPLTKENAETLRNLMGNLPQGVSQEQWMQASALAFKRGLPLTQETVKALHQVLFGKSLPQLLVTLQGQLADALDLVDRASSATREGSAAPQQAAGGAGSAQAPAAAGGARAGSTPLLLTQAAAVLRELAAAAQPAAPAPSGTAGTAAGPQAGAQAAPGANAPSAAAPMGAPAPQGAPAASAASTAAAATAQAAATTAAQGAAPAASSAPVPAARPAASGPMTMPMNGMTAEQPSTRTIAASVQSSSGTAQSSAPATAASIPLAQASAEMLASDAQAPKPTSEPWIGRVLKLLGVEHEQLTWKSLDGAPKGSPATATTSLDPAPPNAAILASGQEGIKSGKFMADALIRQDIQLGNGTPPHPSAAGTTSAPENLKSVLMQLLQADDIPSAMKDTAQQLVQQITGQQLMLSNDRSSTFAHVSLFIPLTTKDGKETATVHIQTRKGKRGELDAGNCHLWFDLQLQALGRTIADVQVVDNIVSLKFHNDQAWLGEWMQERRSDMEQALDRIGYQLISLQTAPLPEKPDVSVPIDMPSDNPARPFTPSSYKGVDLRV
ncbi:hypothetical protein BVG16_14070 [Paenibacillus selenitireducens]|uniref:Uncharacterized protein n=1 Tax=Paenibacillus selenitireducens TaxID=1324314 RepID=A0A1T2XCE7_9BACL|nr:hypothetical protein [Paenibacillus selenitireducens]OPA77569.1 hypothetical protein BVG16_14070 [Paenibacillus selenitireducens]